MRCDLSEASKALDYLSDMMRHTVRQCTVVRLPADGDVQLQGKSSPYGSHFMHGILAAGIGT